MKIKIIYITLIYMMCSAGLFSQTGNQIQVTVRNDRVILINGKPFFPIGTCCERQELYDQLPENGFNFLNLYYQNHFLFSDSCGFHSKDIISGDVTTSAQYNELLGKYAGAIIWDSNAHRIFNYMQNDEFYVFGDDFSFYPDDVDKFIINSGSCGDSIILNPQFNQTVRNASIDRLVTMSHWQGNRLIGTFIYDDANMFVVGNPDRMYYYNHFFNNRVANYRDTYNHFKASYPNSLVMLNLATCYFPRAMQPQNWPDVDVAREAWIQDALQFVPSSDILYSPGLLSYAFSDTNWVIYENTHPIWYPNHLQDVVFGRLVANSNKPVLGGLLFDVAQSLPLENDPAFYNKVKWEVYVSLVKGCTGLIFWGWHKLARPDGTVSIMAWDFVKQVVYEMVKKLHLNEKVFINTNSGQEGHSVSGSTSNNISYAVYKIDGWRDYYLLVTNNPNSSLYATEPDNNVTISCDTGIINWNNSTITELFSGEKMHVYPGESIQQLMPSYGTALFHISPVQVPGNFVLYQNYPNPFNPATKIKYQIAYDGYVTLKIYDDLGREIETLVNGNEKAGTYTYDWTASKYPSGIYFYELRTGNSSSTRKMVLLK